MRWFKPNLRGSIYAIFSSSLGSASETAVLDFTIDNIRDAMLALLARPGSDPFPHVTRRIRYATDVQALWFLRGDLMAVLSSRDGEAAALDKIEAISDMFRDTLPQGLRSRPSPLSSGSRH